MNSIESDEFVLEFRDSSDDEGQVQIVTTFLPQLIDIFTNIHFCLLFAVNYKKKKV